MARAIRIITLRLALVLAGAGLVVSGVVLLIRAVWIAIVPALGAMWASVLLGTLLLLIGALLLALTMQGRGRSAHSDSNLIALLTSSFFEGLAAGRSVRRPSRGIDE